MIKLYSIPTDQQLFNIAEFANKELEDIRKDNISIVFELSKKLLRQVDEHYYFKNSKDASELDFEPSDEVNLIVSGIKFKFVEKQDEETEEVEES